MSSKLNILYTGRFYSAAPRGLTLRQGLRRLGHQVHEVAIDHEVGRPWNYRLARRLDEFKEPVDCVVLADLGQVVASAVSKFCRTRALPLVVDFFFPLYEAMVHDRQVLAPNSLMARMYKRDDRRALKAGNAVFFDTLEHLLSTESLYPNTFSQGHVVPIGCPEHFFDDVTPEPLPESGAFNVLFWGSYIPLQGIEHIIAAARQLASKAPDIKFFLIGKSGQTYQQMRRLAEGLTNLVFVPQIPQDHLRKHIAAADLALGIFGDTDKAERVVPHKVYEALAQGIATISKDSPASRHLLPEGSIHLCRSEALAESILMLRGDDDVRRGLAQAGAQTARELFHPEILGARLETLIRGLLN